MSQDKARSRMGPWRLGPELYAVSLLGSYADWLMAEAHEVHESMGHRASNQDAHQEAGHLGEWRTRPSLRAFQPASGSHLHIPSGSGATK